MSPRATGILLLVAVALGAFVWLYEIEGEAERNIAAEAEKRLFHGIEPEDVIWVERVAGDGTAVRAERVSDGWQIVSPLAFRGDAGAWDSIAAALSESTSESVFEEPQAPEVYGLADGALELRFGTGGGEHALRLGNEAPLGGNTYAAVVGEPPVYTVPTWRASSLKKDLDALRDRRLLHFDAGTVTRVVASWPDSRVELVREDDVWRVVAPVEGPADAAVVKDLLSDLAFLRAQGFEDAPVSDAEAGLAEPAYRVQLSVTDESGEESQTRQLVLEVGSRVTDGTRFARTGAASLYRIPEARLEDLPREVSAYRFKQLAEFEVDDAARIEMVFRDSAGEPVQIDAARDGQVWSSEPEAMAAGKIAGLVRELSSLSADAILAERVGPDELAGLGLAPPRAAFRVRGADGEATLAEVRLGTLQGSEGIVAQAGEAPQVYRLDPALAEHLPVSLGAFRNRFLAGAEDAEAAESPPDLDLDLDADAEGEPATGPDFGVDDETLEEILGSP